MSNDQHSSDQNLSDDEIDGLLREVGPRPEPTPEALQAVRAAVHAEWQSMVAQRSRRKQRMTWSIAASAVLAFGAFWFLRYSIVPPSDSMPLASIVKVQSATSIGKVQVSTSGKTWRDAVAGEILKAGTEVRTDSITRVALDFGNGQSVRLDVGSQLKVLAVNQANLMHGGLYVDASNHDAAPLEVQTKFGAVKHLGTQYQVQLAPGRMTISVREGRVAVDGKYGNTQITANEKVIYNEQGEIGRAPIASHDLGWQWAVQTAPSFAIDKRSLASFLAWVGRETGRTVTYTTPEVRVQAEQLILRGSIDNLSPDQALRAVLATTQFVYTDTPGTIQIGL
jgi:ferric-dicitrate binding protein FerR (iron transport regulator)